MTLAERVALKRADEQVETVELNFSGLRQGNVRRVECLGGCGRWWFWECRLRGGYPPRRCPDCQHKHMLALKRQRSARYRAEGKR